METHFLYEFITLVEKGNFIEAADSLYISQPTLSRHIKRLEEDVQATLIERTSRGVELTNEGEQFLPYARKILSLEKTYARELAQRKKEDQKKVMIGTIPMMTAYGITGIFEKFSREYPDIRLDVTVCKKTELLSGLKEGIFDFVFLREIEKTKDDFIRFRLSNDVMAAALPKDHPLAGELFLFPEQLKDEKLIFPSRNSGLYKICVEVCRARGFEPTVSFAIKGQEAALDLVMRHMGIAFLMKKPCESSDMAARVSIIDFSPPIVATVSAVCKAGEKKSGAAAFLFVLQSLQGQESQRAAGLKYEKEELSGHN